MAGYRIIYKNELYHHGILGQKWGVRRFQNKDGTLTLDGRERRKEQVRSEYNKYMIDRSDRKDGVKHLTKAKLDKRAIDHILEREFDDKEARDSLALMTGITDKQQLKNSLYLNDELTRRFIDHDGDDIVSAHYWVDTYKIKNFEKFTSDQQSACGQLEYIIDYDINRDKVKGYMATWI